MTPEKKAKELVKEYYKFVSGWTPVNRNRGIPYAEYEGEEMKMTRAKQCALIVCNEILNVIETKTQKKFWYDVKAAINALTEK